MTKRIFVGIAICVFFTSFFQPAYTNGGSDEAAEPIAICLLAFLFAASFLLAHTIIKDEAGNYARITQYNAGYWLWLGSIGMLLVTTLIWSPRRLPEGFSE
jgi:hypothetical protein